MRVIALLVLVSCGHKDDNKCMSAQEARTRCQADAIARYYPAQSPQFELNACEIRYPVGGCY